MIIYGTFLCNGKAIILALYLFIPVALHLVEVLSPWRLSTDDVLATQIEVFEESQEEDNARLTMPGGLDLNSHQDVFGALFTKVSTFHILSGLPIWTSHPLSEGLASLAARGSVLAGVDMFCTCWGSGLQHSKLTPLPGPLAKPVAAG